MDLESFLYFIARTLFVLLAFLTFIDYLRYRDWVHLYTTLLLGTLAASFLLGYVAELLPFTDLVSTISWLALLIHPFIFLLLVRQFHSIHRLAQWLALGGLLVSWGLLLLPPILFPLWATLSVPLYFVGIEGYIIAIVWREAVRAQGVTRPRLMLVAAASVLLIIVIILFGLSLSWPQAQSTLTILILILAILIAWGYYLGFVPPAWLNRTWQLAEVHRFLEEVATYPLDERALMVSNLLRQTTMRVVETADVIIACWADRDELLIIDASPPVIDLARQLDNRAGLIGRIWSEWQAIVVNSNELNTPPGSTTTDKNGARASLLASGGLEAHTPFSGRELAEVEQQLLSHLKVNTLMGIPVATSKRVWGVMLVFLVKRPLFETADLSLLTLLAQEMANILAYTALLAEQHTLINRLNRREAALQQAHEQTQALAQVATHLNAQVGSDDSFSAICETVAQLFAVPVVTISLYDEAKKALYLTYDFGLPDDVRREIRALPRVLHDAYIQLAAPVTVTPDVQAMTELPNHELYLRMGLRTTANAPLWHGDLLIGRLNIGTIGEMREFTKQELTLLKGIADQAAIAIHRASLYQQVQEHATQLEQRVAERTAELQARNQELDAFAHTVAHDLKSPLALITGFTNMLIDEHQQLQPDEGAKLLYYISQSSGKMAEIVDALLLLTNTRREDISLETLDMAEIVSHVQERLAYMVHKYEATIVVPDSWPQARGYAPWLEEVWANYVSNAIKYGGRPPHVQLGGDVQADGMLRFWVRDNGPGIPLDKQERLFVPFARLNEEPVEDSHGLGLSIVARIITRLGGQVGCESQPGEGSLFYLTLPCAHE